LSGCLNSTKRIEIVVAALGKSDKLLWRVRERKQALPESDRNREITLPVHDQQRRRDTCDTLIGVKPIPQQPAHRNEPKMRSGNVRYRCIGSFQDQLSNRMIGGYSDRDPAADTSSFMETRQPMLGLAAYARDRRDAKAKRAVDRAAEVFLRRRLAWRVSDGRAIRPDFMALHHPLYYHYDFLGGLVAMAGVGKIRDRRCAAAIDLLEEKRLPDGGWPAQKRYDRGASKTLRTYFDHVDWGGTSARRRNDWVTVDALSVLAAAGRLRA